MPKSLDRKICAWLRRFFVPFIGGLLVVVFPGLAAGAVPLRGIVEGFYGQPWTAAERLDMIRFCGMHGFNAYIYAPKDDPFHRERWREPYPEEKLRELAALTKAARKQGVRLIFALSPGLDARYELLAGAMDRQLLKAKLEAMYAVGIRDFAIFFDDIENPRGNEQADLLRRLDETFVKAHDDIGPLLTVPTEYCREKMQTATGAAATYTREFAANLPSDALVLYTGEGVAKSGLTAKALDAASDLYGRRLGLWWNYPVNDYQEEKLALGPIEKLPENVPAAFFNPMSRPALSRIALATGAMWAGDPTNYRPEDAWRHVIEEEYGPLAPAMLLFAGESRHLENTWAAIGLSDGAALRAAMDDFWRAWPKDRTADAQWQRVHDDIADLAKAAKTLRRKLPRPVLAECHLQLRQLERLTKADILALKLLQCQRDGKGKDMAHLQSALRKELDAIRKNETRARIADRTARAFLEEALQFLELAP